MRILLTRPRLDAERLRRRLEASGHEALIAPVIDIAPTSAPLPSGPFDAMIATSAHAFDFIGRKEADLAFLWDLPLYVVGGRTARAARLRGFRNVVVTSDDAASLLRDLRAWSPKMRRVLFLAGVDRKRRIETALAGDGCEVTVAEVYVARPVDTIDPQISQALRDGAVDAVLHFSRRSASLFVDLAKGAGLDAALRAMRHFCLSADVALGLAKIEPTQALWPERPVTVELLRLLDSANSQGRD